MYIQEKHISIRKKSGPELGEDLIKRNNRSVKNKILPTIIHYFKATVMQKTLFLIAMSLFCLELTSQDRCQDILKVLDKVKNACEIASAQENCNVFVARVVKEMYGINDFENPGSGTGYYSANQIADRLFIELRDKWDNLGSCDQQQVLERAQNTANSNRCVVAVWRNPDNEGHGHVSIILPGQLKKSSSWNLMVPNAANFALGTDANNFVCDRLSGAFGSGKIKQVYIFAQKN